MRYATRYVKLVDVLQFVSQELMVIFTSVPNFISYNVLSYDILDRHLDTPLDKRSYKPLDKPLDNPLY